MATQLKQQEEPIDPPDGDDAPLERDFEAEARSHGWVPKEEFKGDPTRWTDAETFAKRADEVMPLLKKQNQQLKRELDGLKRDFRKASEHFSKAEERAFERAVNDLKARQEAAVETGDTAEFKRLDKEIEDLRKETLGNDDAAPKYSAVDVREALIDFRDANPWYDEDPKMRDYADLLAEKHKDRAAETPPAEFFAFIAERVKERYPDKKQERKARPSAVEAPGGRGQRGQKTFADLPQEAQRICDKWVKNGLIKSREDYVKSYQWD
jgi:polyhydroxyalkanoate synthesis regulator phasin